MELILLIIKNLKFVKILYIYFKKMNPYNNNYSYSPYSNYQKNKISQFESQINSNNNLLNQNQKNNIWNNSYSNYNNPYSSNKTETENKNKYLNPYNFPSNKENDYSIEKTNSTNNNYNVSQISQNSYQNKNIWNSSLPNNPISMYSNDYNKAKTMLESLNKNSYLSSSNYNSNSNYNNNQYNNYSNIFNTNNNNNNYSNDNYNKIYNENKNNIVEDKIEKRFENSQTETWRDFSKYWIFLHHHNLIQGLQNLIYSKNNFFVYMYGTHDTKGKSWCSDCYYAEPNVNLIKGIIASKEIEKEIYFVNIPIDKDKKTFYKENQILKMSHVPTLIYFENGKEIRRIVQDDMFNKDKVVDFVMKSYKKFY